MASIRKRAGKYQVQVRKKGSVPVSKSFTNLRDAQSWARSVEVRIERGELVETTSRRITIAEAIRRYAEDLGLKESDPSRRLIALTPIRERLGHLYITTLRSTHTSDYRDSRLKEVTGSTVRKELAWLSAVITYAVTDLGVVLPQGNPVRDTRLPKSNPARTRRLAYGEEQKLLKVLDKEMADIVVLALETAARRAELLSITREDIDLKHKIWTIPKTKNGSKREVPLSTRALAIIKERIFSQGKFFTMTADTISKKFHQATLTCGLENLRLHDLRHEATSRLFEKGLTHMEVATITGHKDLKMLMRYTHLRASDLVHKIG
jgi:integrase